MKPGSVFRGLSYKSCIDRTRAPHSVTARAFLRKEKDIDGLSVFDNEDSCRKLNIYGIAEVATEEVERFENPVDGLQLAVRYNDPGDPCHLVIENLPFHHLHEQKAELLGGNLARMAILRWEK